MKKLLLVGLGSAMILQASAQEAARVRTSLHDGQKNDEPKYCEEKPN